MWKLLDQIEALLDKNDESDESDETAAPRDRLDQSDLPALRGLIAALRGQEAFTARSDPARTIAFCEEALALLPAQWRYPRGGAFMYWGMSMRAGGQAAAAQRTLIDEYESLLGEGRWLCAAPPTHGVSQLVRDRPA